MADITRKGIIEDKVFTIGEDLAKSLKKGYDQIKKDTADLNKTLNSLFTNAQQANKSLASASSTKESSDANKKLVASQNELIKSQKLLVAAAKEVEAQRKIAEKGYKDSQREAAKLIKEEERLRKEKDKIIKQSPEFKVRQQEINKELRQQARFTLGLDGAYKKLTIELEKARKIQKDLAAEFGRTSKQALAQQKVVSQLDNKVKTIDASSGQFQRNVGNYPKVFGAATNSLKGFIGAFGIIGGITLFARTISNAFQRVRDFDKEMTTLAAVAGTTRNDIQPLEKEIVKVAGSSINTANEVAQLATELIKLGSTPLEAKKLIKPVNDFSIALRASAEDSAAFLKGVLNAYGQGADSADKFADVLAKAANRSALDFQGLNDSLAFVAPTAKQLDIPIERLAAQIGTLADNNIKASRAGRLLNTSFARLVSQGKTLDNALDEIRGSTDKVKTATELFGAESFTIGLILADNEQKVNDLTKEYENAGGSLEKLTNEQLKSLDSQLKILDSTWERLILNVEDGQGVFAKAFVGIIKTISGAIEELITFDAWLDILFGGIKTASEESLQTLLEFGKTDTGKPIRDLIKDITRGIDDKTLVNNIQFFEKELIKSFLREGENFKASARLARAWARSVVADFEDTGDAANESGDKIETGLNDFANAISGLSLEGLQKLEAQLSELQKKKNIFFAATGDEGFKKEAEDIGKQIDQVRLAIAKISEESAQQNLQKVAEAVSKLIDVAESRSAKKIKEAAKKLADELLEISGAELIDKAILDEQVDDFLRARGAEVAATKAANAAKAASDEKYNRERREAFLRTTDDIINYTTEFANVYFQQQQNQLQRDIDLLNQRRDQELANVGENAEAKKAIEEKYAREEAKIRARQAQLDKNQALFQIAITTATNVVKAGGNPYLIAAAIALGAAQSAVVSSQPIPAYGEGTEDSAKDFIAGDKGSELVIEKSGKAFLTPNLPTFYKNKPHSTVISHEDTMKMLSGIALANTFADSRQITSQVSGDRSAEMLNAIIDDRKALLKAVENQRHYSFQMTVDGVKAFVKQNNNRVEYLNHKYR